MPHTTVYELELYPYNLHRKQTTYGYTNCITLGKAHTIKLCALFPKLYSSHNHSLLAVSYYMNTN